MSKVNNSIHENIKVFDPKNIEKNKHKLQEKKYFLTNKFISYPMFQIVENYFEMSIVCHKFQWHALPSAM